MKKIWLINQYAMPPEYELRFQTLKRAQYLSKLGHDVTIISGSFLHNTNKNLIKTNEQFIKADYDGIKFIHIKTNSYRSNGLKRLLNLIIFPLRLFYLHKKFERPNIICHLATVPFGNLIFYIAKSLKAKFIVDVVDLWPESFSAMGLLSKKNPFMKISYMCERWLYSKADKVVFSMEGGKDYIVEKGWDTGSGGEINLEKIHYINNGVDLKEFDCWKSKYTFKDKYLENKSNFNIVYIGSIRLANNLKNLIEAAEILKNHQNIKFFIYGDGNDRDFLEEYSIKMNLKNIFFKERWISSKYIPFILSNSSLNILNYLPNPIFRFGASQSKSFQYMASGKPILSNLKMGYCPINGNNIGIAREFKDPSDYAEAILYFVNLNKDEYDRMCKNSRELARNYDYKHLTDKFNSLLH